MSHASRSSTDGSATGLPPEASGPIRSMTGYGRVVASGPAGRLTAEVRSVNGRFLKLTLKLPPRYGLWEERIKALLAERGLNRGSVEVGIYLEGAGAGAGGYVINEPVVKEYVRRARALAKACRLKSRPSLEALLMLPGAVEQASAEPDVEAAWALCREALVAALAQVDEMRLREGAALAADLRGRIAELRVHHAAAVQAAPAARAAAVARFRERIAQLQQESATPAPPPGDALEREVVMLADRLDVSEELARLGSHLEQMSAALSTGGEAGKKLDFLTQELLRETNTLGSKAQDLETTHRVIEMKGLIERIREQTQNLA